MPTDSQHEELVVKYNSVAFKLQVAQRESHMILEYLQRLLQTASDAERGGVHDVVRERIDEALEIISKKLQQERGSGKSSANRVGNGRD